MRERKGRIYRREDEHQKMLLVQILEEKLSVD